MNSKLPEKIAVVVIGAGQAGLAAGYYLKKSEIPFIILESHPCVGDSWRERWDSLELFTPRYFSSLPGMKVGKKYSYYPKKNEIADYMLAYANGYGLPILTNTAVENVTRSATSFLIKTNTGNITAEQIIIATGPYTTPFIPDFTSKLNDSIVQLHSSQYKNPSQLDGNKVIIVGGGNSATQLTEELYAANKEVVLISTRRPWFLPKTVLGLSSYWWFYFTGILHAGSKTWIAKYVRARGDGIIGTNARKLIDKGLVTYFESRVVDGDDCSVVLANEGTVTADAIIWATGFKPKYKWLKIEDTIDSKGHPIHNQGISPVAGIYWLGIPWQTKINSGIINGVGHDARIIVHKIKDANSNKKGNNHMEDIAGKINSKKAILVDVRTEDEWNEGHAKGAVHIPLDKLPAEYKSKLDVDKQIYIYCGSGKRAGVAKNLLDNAGYQSVNIGGLSDWVKSGGMLSDTSK